MHFWLRHTAHCAGVIVSVQGRVLCQQKGQDKGRCVGSPTGWHAHGGCCGRLLALVAQMWLENTNLVEASFLQWRWLMSGCGKGHDCVYCSCKCRSTWVQFWSWGFDRKENIVNCRHAYAKCNFKWNSLGFEGFNELSMAFSGESTVNCFCCSLVQNKHKILYEKVGILSWAYTIHTLDP